MIMPAGLKLKGVWTFESTEEAVEFGQKHRGDEKIELILLQQMSNQATYGQLIREALDELKGGTSETPAGPDIQTGTDAKKDS